MISSVVSDSSSIPISADMNEGSSTSISKSESLKVDLQRSKNITINTSEGDVVTISSLEEFHTGYYSYQDVTSKNGNISFQESKQLEISSEKMFSLSVEGDLSKQEIKEIKKSLKLVSKILSGYESGDIKKVLKNISKIGNLDTIANLEAAIQQVSSISYEQQSIASTGYLASDEIEQDAQVAATHDSPTSVNQDNIIPENEHSGQKVEDAEDSSHDIKDGVNTVSDKMVDVLKKSDVKPDKLVKSVQNLFSKFLKSFSVGSFSNAPVTNISEMIENDFYKKISDEKENRFGRGKYLDNNNIKDEEDSVIDNTV